MVSSIQGTFLQIGSFGQILYNWEYLGVFDLILPFLLVFAIVFGILSYMKIFGNNRGLHVVIAVILGLLSIRARFFSDFLAEISPRLGVGLVVLLTLLILIGLFTPADHRGAISWILLAIGSVVFIVIMAQAYYLFSPFGFGGLAGTDLISYIVLIALLIGIIVAVVVGKERGTPHRGLTINAPKGLWEG